MYLKRRQPIRSDRNSGDVLEYHYEAYRKAAGEPAAFLRFIKDFVSESAIRVRRTGPDTFCLSPAPAQNQKSEYS